MKKIESVSGTTGITGGTEIRPPQGIINKLGGVWYLKNVLMGLLMAMSGFLLVLVPFCPEIKDADVLGVVLLAGLGVVYVWFGLYLLRSAKEKKGRENSCPYIDPW